LKELFIDPFKQRRLFRNTGVRRHRSPDTPDLKALACDAIAINRIFFWGCRLKMEAQIKSGWLNAFRITNDIWRISDHGQDNIYLITGRDKALVIDTGWGVGDLPRFIRKITGLPVVVANTHGHMDHALGNDSFDSVYAASQDIKHFSYEHLREKRDYIQSIELLTGVKSSLEFDSWGTHAKKQDIPMEDGMEIDLGDRSIVVWRTPGHTKGSVCFLDRKAEVLFAGDSYVPLGKWGPTWFHLKESATLSEFYEKMSRVMDAGGFHSILSGHGECGLIGSAQLSVFLRGMKKIIDGELCGIAEQTFRGNGLRCDWEDVGLIYNPAKIL
jgi:hydroxyacylglutathione hydrolase